MDTMPSAWSGYLTSEDNAQIGNFTRLVNLLIEGARLDLFVATMHLGWEKFALGEEHARGASALEAWPDVLWYYIRDPTKPQDPAKFRAVGRDFDVEAIELRYDRRTRLLEATGRSGLASVNEARVRAALRVLIGLGGSAGSKGEWEAALSGNQQEKFAACREAIERGFVRRYAVADGSEVPAQKVYRRKVREEVSEEGRKFAGVGEDSE